LQLLSRGFELLMRRKCARITKLRFTASP